MRNLSKTVDRILKVEPALESQLLPIKSKWERSNRSIYWKQLLKILNTVVTSDHPKRQEIRNIFIKKPVTSKVRYTFDAPSQIERVLGVVPEDLECKLRKYDRLQVALSKKALEAQMTHDETLINDVSRKHEKLEIKQKIAWSTLKDRFKLWDINEPTSFFIREKDSLLVLTATKTPQGPFGGGTGRSVIPIDQDTIQKLLRLLGPGFMPSEGGPGPIQLPPQE
jgi:hypothetical protein